MFLLGKGKDLSIAKEGSLKIKELRVNRGVTLEIFYFDTGIHLARIEQGKTNITVSTLKRICDYFEINLEEFFKGLKIKKEET